MRRFLLAVPLLVLCPLAAWAQDKITYRTPTGKPTEMTGNIGEETAQRILVKPSLSILSVDVIDVFYQVHINARAAYRAADNAEKKAESSTNPAERKKFLEEAIKNYQAVAATAEVAKDTTNGKFVVRQMEYKVARLTVQLAGEDKAKLAAAAELLDKFRKAHGNSWQLPGCLQKLAEIKMETGDFKGAASAFDDMAKMKELSPEARQRFELSAAQAWLKAGDTKAAEERLTAITRVMKSDDPQYFRLKMTEVQILAGQKDQVDKAITTVRKMLKEVKEGDTTKQAVLMNTLGDCYLAAGRVKEALYTYLDVDLFYNQDRDEHIKAVRQLIKVFDLVRDKQRVKEYQDKLARLNK